MPDDQYSDTDYILAATDVVSAFVSNNSVPATQLPDLIASIHAALRSLAPPVPEPEPEPRVPAVSVKRSVTPEFIVCLEDGKKFKSLKRHLRTQYGITPEEYRVKWGLPADYPMVAPAYAAQRSQLATRMGLGQRGRSARKTAADLEPPAEAAEVPAAPDNARAKGLVPSENVVSGDDPAE
ncbi:MucR family transcriptional regulator [Ancylobacter sonchi]|uniref:MucR family transcriptional regulator n=1 Tax=Ancylobacter sonchi TaxID=1937790 RepID=UPI001BD4DB40|nr:MucR family transcriptional regulator [Ancylobacter sonchi]MBS7532058.1 MucR family transcriptional regulator [Ancylobacter sonchi]